jgi:hypothetical protein
MIAKYVRQHRIDIILAHFMNKNWNSEKELLN